MTRENARLADRGGRRSDGFSLVELSIIMAVVALLATFTIPAIDEFLDRDRIESHCRTMSSLIRRTRLEAIKNSRQAVLRLDTATGAGIAFVDDDADTVLDDGERIIGRSVMQGGITYSAPDTLAVVDGFDALDDEGWIIFNTDGSVTQSGAFRIGDPRGNYLEVRVAPAATAKIKVRKWDEARAVNVDGTHWYSSDEGGGTWKWN